MAALQCTAVCTRMSKPAHDASDPILALMKAGDVAALDRIARDFGPRLVAVALRCCRSPHDVEDAVQNAMIQASRSMTSYQGIGSPFSWMSTLVARSCYRLNAAASRESVELADERCCDDVEPERALERKRLGERVSEALMALPRGDRLMVMLAAEGWTGPEIAEHFATTPVAVRNRLKRARRAVRDFVTESEEGESTR